MTTPCLKPVAASSTRDSPLAFLITFTRNLPRVPLLGVAVCQPSEELRALPTRTTSLSTIRIGRQPSDTQHSVTNALSCNRGTKSRTVPHTDIVASATPPLTNQSSAPPRIRDATKM